MEVLKALCFLIGVIGIPVCLIILIVRVVRGRPLKNIAFMLVACCIIFGVGPNMRFALDAGTGKVARAAPVMASAPAQVDTVKWYAEGSYKVGVDIPAGAYYVVSTSPVGGYWQKASDSTGTPSSVIANDTVKTFGYLSVQDGQYLSVDRAEFTQLENAPLFEPDYGGNYGEGMYLVGRDIPDGEYYLVCTSDIGAYYEIADNCSGVLDSITTNGAFKTTKYVTVGKGQYFKVQRATFSLVN